MIRLFRQITAHLSKQTIQIPKECLEIRSMRSGGPGGQNVNTTSSKAHLKMDILQSPYSEHLSDFKLFYPQNIIQNQYLVLNCSQFVSFHQNKQHCMNQLQNIIQECTKERKERVVTHQPVPTQTQKKKRKMENQRRKETKKRRNGQFD